MDSNDKKKLIKDNVHGYIYIDERYFSIIDSAIFQRLKNIKQTSYISLYPSSTHDRFIHSLGTYYLGSRVIYGLWNNIAGVKELKGKGIKKQKKDYIIYTFEMACLLHDVGHAPFSHTGENLFAVKKIDETLPCYKIIMKHANNKLAWISQIDGLLVDALAEFYDVDFANEDSQSKSEYQTVETFIKDFVSVLRNNSAKPHEKMSAMISLKYLKDELKKIAQEINNKEAIFDADLFVRCIIGASYKTNRSDTSKKDSLWISFKNVIISLLNSDTIDVDKLDYILRDTYMTGYKNMGIDVDRLINSFTVVVEEDRWCRKAYKKNAFSVIENVIAANDSNKRWVQSHPIILYDSYLTQRCIIEAFKILQEEKKIEGSLFEKFFSAASLTEEGIDWIDGERIYLLSDVDAIATIKKAENIAQRNGNTKSFSIFQEYFSRSSRRHSLWKSEMEFRVCFNTKKMNEDERNQYNELQNAVAAINSRKDKTTNIGDYIIDEELYERAMAEGDYPQAGKCLLKNIKTYFDINNKKLDLVILTVKEFESNMKKLNRDNVYVEMPDYALDRWGCSRLYKYSDLVCIPVGNTKSEDIFYFYSKETIDTKDFVRFLLTEAEFDT